MFLICFACFGFLSEMLLQIFAKKIIQDKTCSRPPVAWLVHLRRKPRIIQGIIVWWFRVGRMLWGLYSLLLIIVLFPSLWDHKCVWCIKNILLHLSYSKSLCSLWRVGSGVISRGAQGGGAPLAKISAHFGGGWAPPESLHWLSFSEFIGLASKVLWSIGHCYMVIDAPLLVGYTISVLY